MIKASVSERFDFISALWFLFVILDSEIKILKSVFRKAMVNAFKPEFRKTLSRFLFLFYIVVSWKYEWILMFQFLSTFCKWNTVIRSIKGGNDDVQFHCIKQNQYICHCRYCFKKIPLFISWFIFKVSTQHFHI